MFDKDLTDEQIIEISKENPREIYTSDDGRVIANGLIFDNKRHFEMHLKTSIKIAKFKKFFSFKKKN